MRTIGKNIHLAFMSHVRLLHTALRCFFFISVKFNVVVVDSPAEKLKDNVYQFLRAERRIVGIPHDILAYLILVASKIRLVIPRCDSQLTG